MAQLLQPLRYAGKHLVSLARGHGLRQVLEPAWSAAPARGRGLAVQHGLECLCAHTGSVMPAFVNFPMSPGCHAAPERPASTPAPAPPVRRACRRCRRAGFGRRSAVVRTRSRARGRARRVRPRPVYEGRSVAARQSRIACAGRGSRPRAATAQRSVALSSSPGDVKWAPIAALPHARKAGAPRAAR